MVGGDAFLLGEKVTRRGEKNPVGVVKGFNPDSTIIVSWGVSDNVEYLETIPFDQLQHIA